jgi:hypothetical protein
MYICSPVDEFADGNGPEAIPEGDEDSDDDDVPDLVENFDEVAAE